MADYYTRKQAAYDKLKRVLNTLIKKDDSIELARITLDLTDRYNIGELTIMKRLKQYEQLNFIEIRDRHIYKITKKTL